MKCLKESCINYFKLVFDWLLALIKSPVDVNIILWCKNLPGCFKKIFLLGREEGWVVGGGGQKTNTLYRK